MNTTTCPHCNAVNQHEDAPKHFTVVNCGSCRTDYLRRPAGKVLAVVQRRFEGKSTRWEVTGILGARQALEET